MTNQEQDHWDYEFGCASEAQNCLTEARAVVAAARVAKEGHGPFEAIIMREYFCASTDAFAGMVPVRHVAFATEEELEKFLGGLYREEDDGLFVKVVNPAQDARATAAASFIHDINDDEVPF